MANIKSAMKRAGTNKKENLRNREDKSALKTALRRFDEALQGEDKEAAEAAYLKATRRLSWPASARPPINPKRIDSVRPLSC